MSNVIKTISGASDEERRRRADFVRLFNDRPIPDGEILLNLSLYMNRQAISHMLFMKHLYSEIIDIHGEIFEFGVRWGRNLAILSSLRGIYEPFNYTRKITGFDTFEGFAGVSSSDGAATSIGEGGYSVTEGYETYLEKVLDYHESEQPISHIKKYEIVKGDVSETVPSYLEDNPHVIVAMAYFDLDIYQPTKDCLIAIRDHLTKGSVLGFDEVCSSAFPGETLALRETLGIDKYSLKRVPFHPSASYIVIE